MHLIDNETKVDLLNVERIAATVVKLLRSTWLCCIKFVRHKL